MQRIAGPVPETWTFNKNSNWYVASSSVGYLHSLIIPMPRKPTSIDLTTRYFDGTWHGFDALFDYMNGALRITAQNDLNISAATVLFSLDGTVTF